MSNKASWWKERSLYVSGKKSKARTVIDIIEEIVEGEGVEMELDDDEGDSD